MSDLGAPQVTPDPQCMVGPKADAAANVKRCHPLACAIQTCLDRHRGPLMFEKCKTATNDYDACMKGLPLSHQLNKSPQASVAEAKTG